MNEKKVRKRMIDIGVTQTQMANITGIPRNRVNDALRGRREGRRYVQQILDFLYPLNQHRQ
jgi:transcriptional regulator with XRE-family HTH domain